MDKKYGKEYFKLVQEDEKLVDKPLKTKQLSYFQDALVRFSKNKYNVAATIILVIMILMSIFVPIVTPAKLYKESNPAVATLPPRIPILEKLGIFDGTKKYKNQPIDLSTIVIENDKIIAGVPEKFEETYIVNKKVTYKYQYGSEINEKYVGGTTALYVNYDKIAYAVTSNELINLTSNNYISLDIEEVSENTTLEVYLSDFNTSTATKTWDDLTLVGSFTDAGIKEINLADFANIDNSYLVLKVKLDEASEKGQERVVFNSVNILDQDKTEVKSFSGYELAIFNFLVLNQTNENGRYLRNNAKMLVGSFTYDVYSALFADKPKTIGKNEYEQILLDNPGMAESIVVDPNNAKSWKFGEGYPISSVVDFTSYTIGGKVYVNYNVLMDGAYAVGFETIPYFIFGTDTSGKDLFTLLWLGLRTSLLLGLLAAIVNIFIGIIWGSISAYYGGQTDILMERFKDIWSSFPQITMIGIITIFLNPGFTALFIFMIYDGWVGAASITRIQFYRYRGREYVLAARTLGASDKRIIFKHILPNALGTIVTRVVLSIPSVIFLEVNLSYLGFGIGNGQTLNIGPLNLTGTSIGVILNEGQQQIMAGNVWLIVYPTLIVSILMISFNMFGNALRDALNPQLRGSE